MTEVWAAGALLAASEDTSRLARATGWSNIFAVLGRA
jgi:hypothetical protein